MKEKVKSAGKFLSVKQFACLQNCEKILGFQELKLKTKALEKISFLKDATKRCLMGADISDVFQSYSQEWFESVLQYETEREKDYKKVARLLRYVEEQGYTCQGTNVPYMVTFSKTITIKGIPVSGIKGMIDFVLEREGHRTNVFLQGKALKYSDRAKKPEKKPENAMELMAAALAVADADTVALWSLKNKDDKGATLPAFESRKGKNIVSISADNKEEKLLRLFQNMTQFCEKNCDECFYKEICKLPEVTVQERAEKKEVTEKGEKKIFTDAQQQVIDHTNGPMCCIAVPGAGKTTALTERLISLCKKGIQPESILMLTFTNKAATEIKERVSARLAAEGIKRMPEISTYNAFGYSILKENPTYLGKRLRLADDIDNMKLIADCLLSSPKIEGMSYSGIYSEYGLVNQLFQLFNQIREKGEEIFREEYRERKDVEGILTVYHRYKEEYEKAGYISYDDQITLAGELLSDWPNLLAGYAKRYEYIMVDEFQDSSEDQIDLIYSIAHVHDNIVVVGDDDQAIYGWRGGSSQFMLQFQKDFPSAAMVYMEDNFRSRNGILDVANALICDNSERFKKQIKGHDEETVMPVYAKATTKDFLQVLVKKAVSSGIKPGDIAVLARNHKRLDDAYQVISPIEKCTTPKDFMIEDAVFQMLYDVLNLYYRGVTEDESLYRFFYRLEADARKLELGNGTCLYECMVRKEVIPDLMEGRKSLEALKKMPQTSFTKAAAVLVECFGYAAYGKDLTEILTGILKKTINMEDHPVLRKLLEMAENKAIIKLKKLYNAMDNMVLFRATDRVGYDPAEDAVNLLTCHDSKGKEFRTVIIYGIEDFENTPEEIRVLYVAATRAKKNLYMVETSQNKNMDVFEKMRPWVKIISQN